MADKKRKTSEKPKIEVQTRKPESRGIFANIGKDRQTDNHPLREIMNFPSNTQENIDLDSQKKINQIANSDDNGNPNTSNLDSQKVALGYPNNKNLDSQENIIGYPADNILDSKIAKESDWIAKKSADLDSKIAKSEKLDSQTSEKTKDWKKYDTKRKSKGTFLRTDDDLTKRFKQFCIGKDWDFSYGTELAWNKLMADLDSQKGSELDILIALDDRRMKMIFKTKSSIINLYLRYNAIFNSNTKWKTKDDETASQFNDMYLEIVELGIIQAQINKYQSDPTGSINSFKYYKQEIENFARLGMDEKTLQMILEINRKNWSNLLGKTINLDFLQENKETKKTT